MTLHWNVPLVKIYQQLKNYGSQMSVPGIQHPLV